MHQPLLWALFALYLLIAGYTISHHELWGDELHSWNIAKGSAGFFDLIHNTRYEGHPPVWYTIIWTVSKFTHNLVYVQAVHFIIASLVVFLLLFFAPFAVVTRGLIAFGYFFLFEYAALSRNYAIGLLLAFCICLLLRRELKGRLLLLYYVLLFLLSNTHLLGLVLAGSLHLYFLAARFEQYKNLRAIALHVLPGVLVFLPALYFIAPPSDSEMNTGFWVHRWSISQLATVVYLPLRAFMPVPAWWNHHFWNTQFLLDGQAGFRLLKFINPLISLGVLCLAIAVFRKNRKCLLLFFGNFVVSCVVGLVFPLTSERYTGFVFIGFVVAYWLYCYETPVTRNNKWIVHGLLLVQLVAGWLAVSRDWKYTFSNSYKVNELVAEIPAGEKTVTDYWALNTVSAYVDKPVYCIDLQKEASFILWASDFAVMEKRPYRYCSGLQTLMQQGIKQVYMISIGSPQILSQTDAQLFKSFHVALIDKREGAIEKGSNLYLYKISAY